MKAKLIATIVAFGLLTGWTGLENEVEEVFLDLSFSEEQKETAAELVYNQLSDQLDRITSGRELYERQCSN